MPQRHRALIALAAVAALVAAFLILRPGDDDNATSAAETISTPITTAGATTTAAATAPTTTTTPAATKPAAPKLTTVKVVGLKPVGGVKTIKAKKNDTVRFAVISDQPESVHLHGYDVEKPVAPGKPAKYTFKATIEGIFEVELERAGRQIIKLTVEP